MRKMHALDIDVSNFLPHREPMLMVGSVLEISKNSVATEFYISEDCVFVKDGFFSETGLIENAAQTATGVVGQTFFDPSDVKGTTNKVVGYISAIRKVEILQIPKVGDTIITRSKLLSRLDTGDITMCSLISDTYLDGRIIVTSTMNFLIHEV